MAGFVRLVVCALGALVFAALAHPVAALARPPARPLATQQATLGGGSDIAAGSVVPLPAGITVPPLHHVFADNREARPVEVASRVEAPRGITVAPERDRFSIPPGTSVKNPFSIKVDETVAPGDHRVTVQLVRSDIPSVPGQVTNIPAVGTTFTIRVGGQAATVTVRALSAQSRRPVEGTLTLAARTGPAAQFEVARITGAQLEARVAPGPYRAAYLLENRELAAQDVEVGADRPATVTLEVLTASFVLVSAKPVKEGDKVVVAELVASVENHLRPLSGASALRATVQRDGRQVDAVILRELNELRLGVTEAKLTYRPPGGFPDGDYRFTFELTTPEFALRAHDRPRFSVGGSAFPVAGAAAGGAALVAGVAAAWTLRRRTRRP